MTHSKLPQLSPMARALALTGLALALGGVSGCADTKENQVLSPSILGMTSKTPAFYSDQQTTLYQVQIPVKLPMRKPTDDEAKALGKMAPFPRAPFLTVDDIDVTIHFTLSNLDDEPRTVELLLDPWNEFVRYKPLVTVGDEESLPDFSGFDKFYVLGPKERQEGVITPDDTKEMAIDLATAESIIAAPPPSATDFGVNGLVNRAFNLQNRSSAFDPLLTPIIDSIAHKPGLVGFDLGMRTTVACNVAVEILVDVHDKNGDRVVPPDAADKTFGIPGTLLSAPPPSKQ